MVVIKNPVLLAVASVCLQFHSQVNAIFRMTFPGTEYFFMKGEIHDIMQAPPGESLNTAGSEFIADIPAGGRGPEQEKLSCT